MRRSGQYGDPGGKAYVPAQMQHMSGQRVEQKSNNYQGRQESMTSDKEHPYGAPRGDGHWRWERDGSSHMFNEGQGGDRPRSYYQGQRSDPRMVLERQGNNDPRSHPGDPRMGSDRQGNNDARSHPGEEDMEIGYEDKPMLQTFEGLEQRFLDDIMKLAKEQTDAEDAENARHRESINSINCQYQEQLDALRARHAARRDEILKRETEARQQQYQTVVLDNYPNSGMVHSDPHGYPAAEPHQYDPYVERARFPVGYRDHGLDQRGQYHGPRVPEAGSRYR
ncbi:hypothetical protein DCAR_0313876 [Daucus carota subsp. sativus]|uniref:Uncharacterized protein n=1 Tax=Daucus carota subsp. sativus TaxID=79200 RepID=A0AAF0WR79_DAUCS|nr:PREDICTED: uncharacterized protein LOC108211259 isoform X1 [Daucus carota subsp. sativus]WOG94580.1 hypothetical protein DCAR_0313876 [Daucus carota subsp. sativus]